MEEKIQGGGDGDVSPFKREVDSLVISFADGKAIIHYCNGERLYLATSDPNCGPTKNLMNFHTGDFEMGKKKNLREPLFWSVRIMTRLLCPDVWKFEDK